MPTPAPLALPRALTITGLILGLAAAAHTAAGGPLPAPSVLALLGVLVLLPVTVLARRRLGLGSITAALAAGQVALHAAFNALPQTAEHCTAAGLAVHGHHQAQTIPGCATTGSGLLALNVPALPEPAMTGAHILAVALTALLLTRGEAALWRMLAWFTPLAVILRVTVLPVWVPLAAPRASFFPRLHPCLRIPALRGPPASARGLPASTTL
jgi:hypothetical protein